MSTDTTSRVVCDLSVSTDGFSAGPNQAEDRPFGEGDTSMLHAWMFDTPEENEAERDLITDAKAFIMGRNMFGPIRGEWTGDWNGWWGPEPPYHAPVFVLTNHARDPVVMEGGTTFTFVSDGIEAALERAQEVPGNRNVAIAGGATTINQYLAAGLIDELRLHIAPVTLAAGTRLFDGIPPLKLEQFSARGTSLVTHITYRIIH